MELLQSLLPGAGLLRFDKCEIEGGNHLTLSLSSTQTIVPCPICGGLTHRVHSRYERTLADLPCVHFRLRLILQVCKFFCPNTECCRRIFTERLPEVAAPWARKTVRFIERLQSIGLALGGAAGARLGNLLGSPMYRIRTILSFKAEPIGVQRFQRLNNADCPART